MHGKKRRLLICNALQAISIAISRKTGYTNTQKNSRPQVVIPYDIEIQDDDTLKLMVSERSFLGGNGGLTISIIPEAFQVSFLLLS
jgi:hypothetical protein